MRNSEIEAILEQLGEEMPWPEGLRPMKHYSRTQDDCDGNLQDGITVVFGPDGDAHIYQTGQDCSRFRTHAGGGLSPTTRGALMLLALAIERDNRDNPLLPEPNQDPTRPKPCPVCGKQVHVWKETSTREFLGQPAKPGTAGYSIECCGYKTPFAIGDTLDSIIERWNHHTAEDHRA